MQGNRVVVTGGAGFIGSHIVDALVATGAEVVVIDDLSAGYMRNIEHHGERVEFVEMSITDLSELIEVTKDVDAIVHHAAVASVPQSIDDPIGTHEVNVTGTLNVLEAARINNISKVIYTSSSAVYGDEPTLPKVESMACQPLSPYALHKYMNEQYAALYSELYGLTTIGFRYFNVFGPRQDPSSQYSGVISIFADRIGRDEGVTIFGDGETTRDFVYVGDVVAANIAALQSGMSGAHIYNIGSGNQTSLLELVSALEDVCGRMASVTYADPRTGEVRHSVSDIEKARVELNYQSHTDLKTGLQKIIQDA